MRGETIELMSVSYLNRQLCAYLSEMAGTRPAMTIAMENAERLFFRWRHGRLFICFCGLVHPFDFSVATQFGYQFGLRLSYHKIFDLRLHLFEFRRLFRAFVFNLDDVPAELRFYRLRNLPCF